MESWLRQQGPPKRQCSNAESLKLPFDLGMHNTSIPFAIPCTNASPQNHVLPEFGYSGLPIIEHRRLKEPHGYFNHLPHLRQGFVQNTTLYEKLLPKIDLFGKVPTAFNEVCGESKNPIASVRQAPKQFLVFDQTGNKTTMMFSSGVGSEIQGLSFRGLEPASYCNPSSGEFGIGSDGHHNSGPILTDELDNDHVSNEESELREDSEEIDALLYSDEEGNYSEDGEETSTGHSPFSMTALEEQHWFDEEDTDKVASSAGPPVKRQKLSESSSEVPSVTNAVHPSRSLEYEDDAESSCAGGRPMSSMSGNKRLRNKNIRETVSILQTIIPGGKGKDAVMILDEAINYLRTLQFKAKTLGLSALQ